MSIMSKRVLLSAVIAFLGFTSLIAVPGKAEAGIIPNSVIVPHEYQFPPVLAIPKEGIAGVLSYNLFRNEREAWDGESPVRNQFATVNKIFNFFKLDGVDSVGFAFEALPGYLHVETKDNRSLNGMLDPLVGMVAYTQPIPNWTTALEYWLVLPVGDDNFSGNSWDHQFAFLTNFAYKNFTFDGDIGYKLRGDSHAGGVETSNGDTVYASTVFGYKVMKLVEPYVKFDYMTVGSGEVKSTGTKVPSSDELQFSIGNYFKLTDKFQTSIHYTRGLTGSNTTKANGWDLNFYIVF
jgi:hypothetical protein